MKVWVFGLFAGVLLLAGCSTTSMKGTPFYKGEYEQREGPAADRVNLWPVLYYRDPALSVLWPFMEFSPDHLAVRPLYSVYDRESETPVYNVVWPIARFDTKTGRYRVFPVYWGDEYFNVFPLYWHEGKPLSGKGYDSLFPLWVYYNSGSGTSAHVFWPLYAKFDHAHHQGWRLWPLFGTNDRLDEKNSWWLASLGYSYDRGETKGHGFIPFYGYESDAKRSTCVSLPYSRSITLEPGGLSWDVALPLWCRSWKGTTNSWGVIPLLSWGSHSPEFRESWYAAGLIHGKKAEDTGSSHVLPFYYTDYSENHRSVYTLPWWSKKYEDGTGWHTLVPFYYTERSAKKDRFYSLPWWSEDHVDGSGWSASFPFYYGSYSTNSSVVVTPLYARKKMADGSPAWSCYIPLVYFDRTRDAHYMTLLGGAWRDGDEKRWIALPVLSGSRSDAESGRTVWLAGLAGKKWSPEEYSHYVFPLYHYAPAEKRFSSIVYSTWPEGSARRSMIPLLLSGQKVEGDYALKFGLLGMFLSEEKAGVRTKSQVIPFYSWERDDYFYTALYGWDAGMKYYLTPIAGRYAGDRSGSWFFPLYRHRKDASGNIDGRYLLLGSYSKEPKKRHHKFWGIYSFRESESLRKWKDPDDVQFRKRLSYLLLGFNNETETYAIEGGKKVLVKRRKKKGFALLWDRDKREDVLNKKSEAESSVLMALYDSRHEQQPEHDYLRRRILWRLWHYEKLNGDVSTDIFPGITVDSYENGYYKCSVLWRLFRYEKDPETGRKELDLFFMRSKTEHHGISRG